MISPSEAKKQFSDGTQELAAMLADVFGVDEGGDYEGMFDPSRGLAKSLSSMVGLRLPSLSCRLRDLAVCL